MSAVIYDNVSVICLGQPTHIRLVRAVNVIYCHSSDAVIGDLVGEDGAYSVRIVVTPDLYVGHNLAHR